MEMRRLAKEKSRISNLSSSLSEGALSSSLALSSSSGMPSKAKFGVLLNWKRPKLELSYRFKVWMAKLFAIGKFPINWIAFKLFYGAVVWTRVFKYGYMSHFMSEKKHYQENADSVEEMLSNFTNSNGSTGEINKYLKCLVHEGYT